MVIDREELITTLNKFDYAKYGIKRVGLAGSYANGTATEKSDVDIVLDSEIEDESIECIEAIREFIKKNFRKKSDVMYLVELEEEDKELDELCKIAGISINKDSVYKTIVREVIWFKEL